MKYLQESDTLDTLLNSRFLEWMPSLVNSIFSIFNRSRVTSSFYIMCTYTSKPRLVPFDRTAIHTPLKELLTLCNKGKPKTFQVEIYNIKNLECTLFYQTTCFHFHPSTRYTHEWWMNEWLISIITQQW